jgi:hypothetical protein
MEIIVDAYGGEEQALGWYYYLDDRFSFPSSPGALPREQYPL